MTKLEHQHVSQEKAEELAKKMQQLPDSHPVALLCSTCRNLIEDAFKNYPIAEQHPRLSEEKDAWFEQGTGLSEENDAWPEQNASPEGLYHCEDKEMNKAMENARSYQEGKEIALAKNIDLHSLRKVLKELREVKGEIGEKHRSKDAQKSMNEKDLCFFLEAILGNRVVLGDEPFIKQFGHTSERARIRLTEASGKAPSLTQEEIRFLVSINAATLKDVDDE